MFRTFCHWFRTLEKGASNRHAKKYTHVQKPRKRSLRLESLENRQLLSVNPVTDDVVLSSSSIVSEQELQNVIGANFNSAEVEQVSSNDTMDLDLLFQRPITLENSIAISQLMQPYSSGSGLFDNVNIGIAI
ncbi:MAG: hypothetical protein PHE53_13250 [Thermoguttaceae bacterium]|nr:hypothetical protein [Thermoguttaceae bacterium]